MRKTKLTTSIAALALAASGLGILSGCEGKADAAPAENTATHATENEAAPNSTGNEILLHEILANYGYSGMDVRTFANTLEALPLDERPTSLTAAVHTDGIHLSDTSGNKAVMPMPEGETYVGFAPFEHYTNNCLVHRLTTDMAELANEAFDVTVTDNATGEILAQQAVTTKASGFFGMWLPTGKDATITVTTADGRSAMTTFSTKDDAPSCVATLHLQ